MILIRLTYPINEEKPPQARGVGYQDVDGWHALGKTGQSEDVA